MLPLRFTWMNFHFLFFIVIFDMNMWLHLSLITAKHKLLLLYLLDILLTLLFFDWTKLRVGEVNSIVLDAVWRLDWSYCPLAKWLLKLLELLVLMMLLRINWAFLHSRVVLTLENIKITVVSSKINVYLVLFDISIRLIISW